MESCEKKEVEVGKLFGAGCIPYSYEHNFILKLKKIVHGEPRIKVGHPNLCQFSISYVTFYQQYVFPGGAVMLCK